MWKTATPPVPSDEQLKALAQLLAVSQQQAKARRSERREAAFYVVFGLVVFLLAWAAGYLR